MANDYDMPPLRPEAERDSYGRYVLPDPSNPNGAVKHFTRATTLAKALDDTYNLQRYQQRMITQGFKVQPELLDSIDLMEDDRKLRDILQGVADQAYEAAGGNEKSTRGTQLHYFSEALDGGYITLEQVPDEYRRELAAYRATMDRHGILTPPEGIERIVFNSMANIVGTADRLPVVFPDGTKMVADVKSGADLGYSWGAIAMQLATYANADAMVEYDADGNPFWDAIPVVEPDVGLVMHIPVDQGKCDLYLVDLAAGRAAIELALEVREYRRRKNLHRSLPVGRYGMPAAAAPERLDNPDPFATVPADESQTAPTESVPTPLELPAPVGELDPLETAQALLDTAKGKAADIRSGRKRRNSAQVAADKAATQAETAIPNAEVITNAALALAEAYGFSLEDELEPEQECIDKAAALAVSTAQAMADIADGADKAQAAPDGPLPVSHFTTAHGVHVARQEGETDESLTRRTRIVELQHILTEVITSQEEAAQAYEAYADVWSDYHTNTAQGRLAELSRQEPQPEPRDPILEALDGCRTAADMGAVWENFQNEWNDSYTEYGQRVLASV